MVRVSMFFVLLSLSVLSYAQKPRKPGRATKPQVPVILVSEMKVGAIGYIQKTGISQDGEDIYDVGALGSGTEDVWKVIQVIDEKNMLVGVSRHFNPRTVWVNGVSTAGLIDGAYKKLDQIFEVTGTKRYETALGSASTVFVISPYAIQDPKAFIAKVQGDADPARKAPREKPAAPKPGSELRTWKDATGKFTIEAKFGGIVGGKVLLVKEDGDKVFVTREQLSKADNEYLDDLTKK